MSKILAKLTAIAVSVILACGAVPVGAFAEEEKIDSTAENITAAAEVSTQNYGVIQNGGITVPQGFEIAAPNGVGIEKAPYVYGTEAAYERDKYSSAYTYNTISQSALGEKLQTAYLRVYNDLLDVHYACEAPSGTITVSDTYYIACETDLSDLKLTRDDISTLYSAVAYSNPQFYWLGKAFFFYLSSDNCINTLVLVFDDDYTSAETRSAYNSLIDQKAQEYADAAKDCSSSYEKVKAVYDKLISEVEYAYDSNGYPVNDQWAHSVIGAFDDSYSEVVCEGYSSALSLVLNYIGIDNIFVTGIANQGSQGGHAWNLIKLDDGLYYWFDPTWDDPGQYSTTSDYEYFAATDDVFCYTHIHGTVDDTSIMFCPPLPEISDAPFDLDIIKAEGGETETFSSDGMDFIGNKAEKTCVLTAYSGSGDLSVPSTVNGYTVTEIGDNAFESCYGLTSITLPYSVKKVGKEAFKYCTSLTTVLLEGVIDIEENAFSGCSSLNSFTAYHGLKAIGNEAFLNCTSLTEIVIPYSIKYIGNESFVNTGLKSISLSDNYSQQYSYTDGILYSKYGGVLVAYPNCYEAESFTIPESVTEIGDSAFYGNKNLSRISIGGNVTKIGENAFQDSSLIYAELLEPVETVESYAFYQCRELSSIKIYDSVTDIGFRAFGYYLDKETNSDAVETALKVMCRSGTVIESYCEQNGITHINYDGSHDHSYTSKITTPATCTADGVRTFTCAACGDSYTETIKATGHSYTTKVVAPTYAAKGYTLHTCSVCGYSFKDTYTAKLVLPNVTGLKMTANTPNSISMSWTKVTGATGYVVYQAIDGKWQRIKVTSGNTLTVSSLNAGTDYKFTVKAYKTVDGNNYYSSSYTGVWMTTLPANVSGLKMTSNATNSISMSWDKVTGATGYVVYQAIDGKWERIKVTSGNTLTVSSLKAGTNYKFTVKAYKTFGGTNYYCAGYTGVWMTTLPAKPAAKMSSNSTSAVKLSWSNVTSATGYVVYQYTGGKWVKKATVKTNYYTISGLNAGTNYNFAVRAYKTFEGKNYYSPFATATDTIKTCTKPATVTFTLTAGTKKATVNWSKVTGATGYIVYYKTSANGSWQKLATTTGTTYTKTGLTTGKTYYFTVKAYKTYNGVTYNASFTTKSVTSK